MNITKRAKLIIGGVALVSAVAIGGAAFTAGGVSNPGGNGGFIGGQVTQGITGAVVTNVVYTVDDTTTPNTITSVLVTFTGNASIGKAVTLAFTDDLDAPMGSYICGNIASGGTPVALTSTCTGGPAADTDVSNVAIAVAS